MSVCLIGSERPWSLLSRFGADSLGEWSFSSGDSFEAMAGVYDDGRTLLSVAIVMRDAMLRITRGTRRGLVIVRGGSFLTRKEHAHTFSGLRRSVLTPRCRVSVLADGEGTPFLHARYLGPPPRLTLAGSPLHTVLSVTSSPSIHDVAGLLGPFGALAEEAGSAEFQREAERRERLTNAEREREDAARLAGRS